MRVLKSIIFFVKGIFEFRRGKFGELVEDFGYYVVLMDFGDFYFVIIMDGVGMKVLVVEVVGKFDMIGIDMIVMNVNDLFCVGVELVVLVDYFVVKELDERVFEGIV